jgi:dethiobiotin synthetase|tara:strand:- start:257 stop:961 length:705 start_codon:yes stop_codon:yes gene_type:complete
LLEVDELLEQNVLMIPINTSGYFITGSDTDVGKTYITCEIIRQLQQFNFTLETRKPAESGCKLGEFGEMVPADGLKLQAANQHREDIDRITPLKFKAALAPHRAARLEDRQLSVNQLLNACSRDNCNSTLIVEGAGGFFSPIADDGLNADLATLLQLPTVIVINDKIGAVNQALLTVQAIENSGLAIAAIILNQVEKKTTLNMNNLEDLQSRCRHPVFCCDNQKALPLIFKTLY